MICSLKEKKNIFNSYQTSIICMKRLFHQRDLENKAHKIYKNQF